MDELELLACWSPEYEEEQFPIRLPDPQGDHFRIDQLQHAQESGQDEIIGSRQLVAATSSTGGGS